MANENEGAENSASANPPIEQLSPDQLDQIETQIKELADANVKQSGLISPTAILSTLSLLMFVGGGLVTLMMAARAFDLHGTQLVGFVIVSCALVLGLAGGLLLRSMGDRWWIGAVMGACFGALSAMMIYAKTKHYSWWQ